MVQHMLCNSFGYVFVQTIQSLNWCKDVQSLEKKSRGNYGLYYQMYEFPMLSSTGALLDSADLASFPGKLQQAAETVKETKAEPTQPRRKKLADLKWMFDCVTVGLFLGGYLWDMAVDSLEL